MCMMLYTKLSSMYVHAVKWHKERLFTTAVRWRSTIFVIVKWSMLLAMPPYCYLRILPFLLSLRFTCIHAYITCPIGSISWSEMDFEPSSCGKISIKQAFLSIFTLILLEFWSMTHSTLLLRSPEHWREQPDHADTSHLKQFILESGACTYL